MDRRRRRPEPDPRPNKESTFGTHFPATLTDGKLAIHAESPADHPYAPRYDTAGHFWVDFSPFFFFEMPVRTKFFRARDDSTTAAGYGSVCTLTTRGPFLNRNVSSPCVRTMALTL